MSDTPRIYVACLESYNEGTLHGAWIDADQDAEDIREAIAEAITGEEWAIHDFEGFGDYRLSEHESIDDVAKLGAGIAEHGEAYAAWATYNGIDFVESFEDAYRGEWQSEEEYAREDAEMMGHQVPEWLEFYVDWEAYATCSLTASWAFRPAMATSTSSIGGANDDAQST